MKNYVYFENSTLPKHDKKSCEEIGKCLTLDFGSDVKLHCKKLLTNDMIQLHTREYNEIDLRKIQSLFKNNAFIHTKEIHMCYEATDEARFVIKGTWSRQKQQKQDIVTDELKFVYRNPIITTTSVFKKNIKNLRKQKRCEYFCKLFINNIYKDFLSNKIINDTDFVFNLGIDGSDIKIQWKLGKNYGKISIDDLENLINLFILETPFITKGNSTYYLTPNSGVFVFQCEQLNKRKRVEDETVSYGNVRKKVKTIE